MSDHFASDEATVVATGVRLRFASAYLDVVTTGARSHFESSPLDLLTPIVTGRPQVLSPRRGLSLPLTLRLRWPLPGQE